MACLNDIKKLVLDDINQIFVEGRYTYYRLNEDTFRIANQQETGGKSKAKSEAQAIKIAVELRNRIIDKYGNNVFVQVLLPDYVGLPVEIKVTPDPSYLNKLYAQVKPEKRTEYVSREAFLQDDALYQQELREDEPLNMIPYEAWAAQYRAPNPIIDEKGQMKFFQRPSLEGQLVSEKTIRDLAARMSARIGMPFKIISDRTQEFKGKLEGNVAVINLAYTTLDTPIHEILAHPIIRAIKNRKHFDGSIDKYNDAMVEFLDKNPNATREEAIAYADKKIGNNQTDLYQNLLKELETGRGKEILDRIKRDYQVKYDFKKGEKEALEDKAKENNWTKEEYQIELAKIQKPYTLEEQQEEALVELLGLMTAEKLDAVKDIKLISLLKQLLGRIKAFVRDIILQKEVNIDSLPDNMTIGDLASVLAYSNSKLILPGYEVEYTTPDNMKFKTYAEASNHISELAKSAEEVDLESIDIDNNNFFYEGKNYIKKDGKWFYERYESYYKDYNVLPGYKKSEPFVKLNISKGLPIRYDKDVITSFDIQNFKSNKDIQKHIENFIKNNLNVKVEKVLQEIDISNLHFNSYGGSNAANNLQGFIEKNKEYEQSKEIVEEWKKVNNIQYNPEEVYSRGQEFVSVVGAYSNFDVNLMMQNLLQHIEDNEKAGGEFTISAFTKPVDKKIGHLEGVGGKIKFKIYPQSKDIKWAANSDVYSGSVWDASTKISKDKKSELLGVSYTKYPSLSNVNKVQPNLASIIDDLAHHHNELGISLTGNNFRLEYDENIPYQTKKIIDSVNAILDQKYGKLVKPEIKKFKKQTILIDNPLPENQRSGVLSYSSDVGGGYFLDTVYGFERRGYASGDKIPYWQVEKILKIAYPNSVISLQFYTNKVLVDGEDIVTYSGLKYETPNKIEKEVTGTQPTQTKDNLKESIEGVKNKLKGSITDEYGTEYKLTSVPVTQFPNNKIGDTIKLKGYDYKIIAQIAEQEDWDGSIEPEMWKIEFVKIDSKKEYIEQALINTKIAALKEVAKKYPRSLIRSEVIPANSYVEASLGFDFDELPFQKIPSSMYVQDNATLLQTLNVTDPIIKVPDVMATIIYQNQNCK